MLVHPVFVAFEWDEFTRIAFAMRAHCSQIINLLKCAAAKLHLLLPRLNPTNPLPLSLSARAGSQFRGPTFTCSTC